jgi:hypothetical protein
MRIKIFTLGLLLLSGCTGAVAFNSNLPDSEIGAMPPDAFGAAVVGEDPDIAAANAAEEAFAYPGEMQGRPAEMALAIASLDAMAGQFATGGRWLMMSDSAKLEMLGARGEVRAILGVPANADSQDVIDGLVGAAQAIKRGDQNGAILALSGPEFTRGPQATLALLGHFPAVREANVATMDASQYLYPMDGGPGGGLD